MNAEDQDWGEDNLIACAKNCAGLTAREALDRINERGSRIRGGAPQHDDMTLTVRRVVG